ncbi:MAG TPA: glycoside hydrolase family 99-like domain-containing protein, partial [Verrucomicrobiae bacterium]
KHTFPLEPDGRERTYNIDLLRAPGWGGTVLALGLQPSNDTNAVATLSHLGIGNEPEGPPHLRVLSFALEEALPRAGLPAALTAIFSNDGGGVASNVLAELELPASLKLLGSSATSQIIPRLGFDEEKTLTWTVEATSPGTNRVRLKLSAVGAEPVLVSALALVTPRLPAASSGYVPEPKPVRGPYEVGVYYFPGWKTASQWEPLKRFPERKPVLGWYREGDPEVADWHIKWAVEHGITFFAYDWYWSKGARQLEHGLHDGYFKARYRNLLKFCLLWANHNPPGSSSHEDCIAVTRYWIENYFRRPEHLMFNGKPVVIIFAPDRFTQDLGSEGTQKAFEAMRGECRAAGLKGLYLVACVGDAGGARRAAEEGYDSVTAYNWPGLGMTGDGMFGPFDSLVEGYRRHWDHLLDQGRLPLAPLPVCGGWDSRPWHGENNLVRFGRTPGLFKQHLLDARRLQESGRFKPPTPKAILIEAWNEWGEGSYIEPHSEFGFGYLDALRETFSGAPPVHVDVTPADAGLGPYDVVPSEPGLTAWDFAGTDNGWNNTMQLDGLKVADGVLSTRSTGNDPAFFGPPIRVAASDFSAVVVRMRLSRTTGESGVDSAQLFWRTARVAESESTSARFEVMIDGNWHEYRIPVATNPRWRGSVIRLRLDPVNQPDIQIDISRIELGS